MRRQIRIVALANVVLLTQVLGGSGSADDAVVSNVMGAQKRIRVACVGDSITAGSGTKHPARESYPAQLQQMLGPDWVVDNFGASGATLLRHGDKPYQNQAAFTNALASAPDMVVILLGTNDTKPQNWNWNGEFVADYRDLIGQFTRLPSKPRLFICYPPFVSGENMLGISEAGVLREKPLIDKVAVDKAIVKVDLHSPLKGHDELFSDTVHPNVSGAAILAKTVFRALTGKEFTGTLTRGDPSAAPVTK